MKTIIQPEQALWPELCRRPVLNTENLTGTVTAIMEAVQQRGDNALREYALQLGGAILNEIAVSATEIQEAEQALPANLKEAIQTAAKNIGTFHRSQLQPEQVTETTTGITCWRKSVGIENVGLYIPGGTAPLFSTVLMLAIPAKLAGCKNIILCSPPNSNGEIHPAILYAASVSGVSAIFKAGGAQAIAAMAFGTATIPKVNKIFGPGNQYVTRAKELVQQTGVAIDMPAGPSEVLVIADDTAIPSFVAADLLAQAEHGTDSQVVLLTTSEQMAQQVNTELEQQLALLPRKDITEGALQHSFTLVLSSLEDCMAFSNAYAPEHLVLATANAAELAAQVINAGSVFIGNYSCESVGDYASGPNHTLPTNGYARNYSGVSADSFVKKITFQQITAAGIRNIGEKVALLAEAEGLEAHKNAVLVRLNNLGHL